jgi:hypothetical protein
VRHGEIRDGKMLRLKEGIKIPSLKSTGDDDAFENVAPGTDVSVNLRQISI